MQNQALIPIEYSYKMDSNQHHNFISKPLRLLFGFLIFSSSPSLHHSNAEICTQCSNASHIMNDAYTASIVWPPGNSDNAGFPCYEVALKAASGYFNSCAVLHSWSDFVCNCGEPEGDFICSLCGDGVPLPEPNRIVAGKTCHAWQEHATFDDFQEDCPNYQKAVGAYCGCDISTPGYWDGFCRVCGDTILPDHTEEVVFDNGDKKDCVQVEVDINTPYYSNCSFQQEKYKKSCGCEKNVFDIPTLSPTKTRSSSIRSVLSFQMKLILLMSLSLHGIEFL